MTQFEIGVYDSVAHFNIGNLATLMVYDNVNIERGYYTIHGCDTDNKYRLRNARRQSNETYRMRRRLIRGKKKKKVDKHNEAEGSLYGAGSF